MELLDIPIAQWERWNYTVSMAATVAFAVTGVIAVTRDNEDCDLMGAIVFGVITGTGGGTIRDAILGVRPFWVDDQSYVAVAAGAAVAAFYLRRLFRRLGGIYGALVYLDGLGAAMFAVQATGLVWLHDFGRPAGPILLGVITGIGGGLVRDVLAGRRTMLMRKELYATPVLLGCVSSVLILSWIPGKWEGASLLCIAGTFALRAAAIRWRLTLPRWARSGGSIR